MDPKRVQPLDKAGLERQSQFRYEFRRFLRFGEEAAKAAGVTAVQYHLMLHTQAFAGRDWASVGELAERLQIQPHGVVALVTRCEEAGLVTRTPSTRDRRQVQVRLTPVGEATMRRVAEPSEMAGAVLYLVSPAASYTTGVCLNVDGGYLTA